MILITGGTRSGKTAVAEKFCRNFGQKVLYLAVTIPSDPDSRERIKRSRGHRPYYWDTYETDIQLEDVVLEKGGTYDVILIDSMNNLIFNLVSAYTEESMSQISDYRSIEMKIMTAIRSIVKNCLNQKAQFIFVTSEMGQGMTSRSPFYRCFSEIMGQVNQYMAENCSHVYMVVCGLEVKIK